MSRILAYTSPCRGHLFPLVPVLQELQRRGHQVALRTLAGEVGAMRSLGFDAAPIDAEIEALPMDDWKARGRLDRGRRTGRTLCARAPHEAPDLLRAIEDERPDALLVDILSWGALSAAEAWGGPWACFSPPFLPLSSRSGLTRAVVRAGFDTLARPTVAKLRADLGLPPFRHADEMFRVPSLLLYMTAEPFEHQRPDWPESIFMVGPCAWEPPGGLPAELAGVEEPLVLVTTSTEFQNDGRLVRTALEALSAEPFHVVATMPLANAPELSVPDNATVVPFAPHGPILDRAACAITHGGMGATQKALARGVPVCVVPFGRDQPDVARRVEAAGAGSWLPSSRLRPDRLRTKVGEAIACRPGAERIATAFASAGGAVAAADAFEQRLLDA